MPDQHESISRRTFGKAAALGVAAAASGSFGRLAARAAETGAALRLGGPVFENNESPDQWVSALKALGYSAAYCPVDEDAPQDIVAAYETAARQANIVIAEVGVWNNPLTPDDAARKAAFDKCCRRLDLADRIGAKCCVNVAGSRNPEGGAHPENLTEETFDMVVEVTRRIIDAVKPTRTSFTLETLPYMFPDSVDSYVRLVQAIDRPAYGVHLDPVNVIFTYRRYYNNAEIIRDFFARLGPHIKSCHGKDILLKEGFPVNLAEVRPGLGQLDYAVYLKELSRLADPPPLMLEHLETAAEYRQAAEYVRSVAKRVGLSFV